MNNIQLLFFFGSVIVLPGFLQRLRGGVVWERDRIMATIPALLAFSWFGFIKDTGNYSVLFWVLLIFASVFFLTGGLTTKRILFSTKGWEHLPEALKTSLKAKGISAKIHTLEDGKHRIRKRLDLKNRKAVVTISCSRTSAGKTGDCVIIIKDSKGENDVHEAIHDMIRASQVKYPYTGSFNEYLYYLLGILMVLGAGFLIMRG